jgi:hypothetical protein
VNVKVKLSMCLVRVPCHEDVSIPELSTTFKVDVCGSEGIAPHILNLDTR